MEILILVIEQKKRLGNVNKNRNIMDISLTVQLGGSNAGQYFRKPIVGLRKSFKLLNNSSYSEEVGKIKFFLRIGGEIENYNEEAGIHNLKYSKRYKNCSGEIIVSENDWKNKTNIKLFLSEQVEKFSLSLSDFLQKKKVNFDRDQFLNDINSIVIKNYNMELET